VADENTHALYLRDLASVLLEEAQRARASAPSPAGEWDKGYLMALVSALDLMRQQALAFNLPLSDLGPLAEVEPERDLLSRAPIED
jgi:hypothetical protein